MTIHTIVTDCDDTLLQDDLTISPFTRKVLTAAHDKGIRIILSSGRAAASLLPIVRSLGFSDPYIACNGAVIMDGQTHTPLSEVFFTVDEARECARFYKAHDMYAQYYLNDKFYFSHEGEFSRAYAEATSMQGECVGDLEASIQTPVSKLLGMDTVEKVAKVYQEALAQFAGRASIMLSKPYFLEMNPINATKGKALDRLSAFMDISPDTTMAFGDSLNDIPMLKWAKYGVAMGNARDEVKRAVTLTCGTNREDGMAHMILKHILKEELS